MRQASTAPSTGNTAGPWERGNPQVPMGCLHVAAEIPVQAEDGLWGVIPEPNHLIGIIKVFRQTRQMKRSIENQER